MKLEERFIEYMKKRAKYCIDKMCPFDFGITRYPDPDIGCSGIDEVDDCEKACRKCWENSLKEVESERD